MSSTRSSGRIRPLPRRLDSLSGPSGLPSRSGGAPKAVPKASFKQSKSELDVDIKEESTGGTTVRDILARSKLEPSRPVKSESDKPARHQVIREDVSVGEMRLDRVFHSQPALGTVSVAPTLSVVGSCPPLTLDMPSSAMQSSPYMMIQMPCTLPPLSGSKQLCQFGDIPDGCIGSLRTHASGRRTMLIGNVLFEVTEGKRNDAEQFVCISPTDGEAIFLGESSSRLVVCPVID